LCATVLVVLAIGFLYWKNRQSKAPGGTLSSVVVLPFLDLSPQKDQDYFSDGLTEEIIDGLSRVPNLRVVARTSAFAFKGKAADIRAIGQQLNVSAVLEGSVRKSGDQLRITAQLNRVSDGTHLWSRTYDRQLRDVFAVQREISQSIADQLRAGQVPHREPTANLEAYRLYQEGRYFFNQHLGPDSYRKAIERYQQAIERDPKFALSYSGLADAYAYLAESFVVAPREVMPKAKEAAEKAVALDDSLGEGHASLGIVKLDYEWDRGGSPARISASHATEPRFGVGASLVCAFAGGTGAPGRGSDRDARIAGPGPAGGADLLGCRQRADSRPAI
jgi:serine/threonine-protein kinase